MHNSTAQKFTFTHIYDSGQWNGPWNTNDGGGSGLIYTESLRSQLPAFFKKWNITSIFDASCGEFTWMQAVDLTGIKYIGGEIVADKIARNKIKWPQHTWLEFDILTDTFPEADMWMCRDTLFHFPLFYLQKALRNFVNSNIKYLLTSSHPGPWGGGHRFHPNFLIQNNVIWNFGDFTNLNVFKHPYNFSAALDSLDDTCYSVAPLQREMVLFDRETIGKLPFLDEDIPEPPVA